jgi:hypothetical protein
MLVSATTATFQARRNEVAAQAERECGDEHYRPSHRPRRRRLLAQRRTRSMVCQERRLRCRVRRPLSGRARSGSPRRARPLGARRRGRPRAAGAARPVPAQHLAGQRPHARDRRQGPGRCPRRDRGWPRPEGGRRPAPVFLPAVHALRIARGPGALGRAQRGARCQHAAALWFCTATSLRASAAFRTATGCSDASAAPRSSASWTTVALRANPAAAAPTGSATDSHRLRSWRS